MTRVKSYLRSLFRRSASPCATPGQRIYAIGDVHGRLDLLDRLIDRISADHLARAGNATAEIILLGDLIDRGPDSAGVVDHAIGWRRPDITLTVLKGNHEASLLAVLDGETRWLRSWLSYGGQECLQSYGVSLATLMNDDDDAIVAAARRAVPVHHRAWLSALPLTVRRGAYYFVHAGVRPGIPLDDQVEADLIWIRQQFLDSNADHGAVVVHGHTIADTITIRPNRIGLDTGAYRSGVLSAVGLDGADRWFLSTGA